MRVHSKIITLTDIYLRATENLPGVYATATEHGSRSHGTAFEVSLEGNGYARNTGTRGAARDGYDEAPKGATWDEWGAFIAALYEIDPDAVWGSVKRPVYRNKDNFDFMTYDRFAATPGHLPADTHKRHNWMFAIPREQVCSKCSAYRRFA